MVRIDETTVVGRLKAPEDVQLVLEAYSPGAGDSRNLQRRQKTVRSMGAFIDGGIRRGLHFVWL